MKLAPYWRQPVFMIATVVGLLMIGVGFMLLLPGTSHLTACGLVTASDVQQVIGKPASPEGAESETSCFYDSGSAAVDINVQDCSLEPATFERPVSGVGLRAGFDNHAGPFTTDKTSFHVVTSSACFYIEVDEAQFSDSASAEKLGAIAAGRLQS